MIYKALTLLMLSLSFHADSAEELSLDRFLILAEKNDPEFKKVIVEKQAIKNLVDYGLPSRKIVLTINKEEGISSESDQDTSRFSGDISKEFIETGTSVSLTHTKTTRPDRKENVTEFRVEQSIYKNFFGRDVRLKKTTLTQEAEQETYKMLEDYENYLVKIITIFLDYKKSYLDFLLSEEIYADAEKLKKNVQKKFNSKIASRTDLNRAKLLLIRREEELTKSKESLTSAKREMQKIIGSKVNDFKFAETAINEKILNDDNTDAIKRTQQDLRAVKIYILGEEIAQKNYELTKRSGSPDLNLLAGYNKDNSERFSSTVDRDETVIGLSLEIPIGDTKNKAAVQLAKVDLDKANFDKNLILNQVKNDLENIESKLNEQRRLLKLSKEKVDLIKSILVDEERRYAYGKIDLEQLIETKSSYAEYRIQYRANLLEYNKTLLGWYSVNDRLLGVKSKSKIKLFQ